jgi:hypothetical protein
LPDKPCQRAIAAAKTIGYRELPLPDDIKPPYVEGQPTIPKRGLFRYTNPIPKEMRLSWIDADTCRVYVEFNLE